MDRDADILAAVRSVLEDAGCVVETAGTVAEAAERVRDFAPDVVLLDVGLHGADESAFMGRLKQDPATQRIPVVVMSGSPATLRRIAPRADGALEKPFDLETLFDTLEELCGNVAA